MHAVVEIIEEVKQKGDQALFNFTRRFDNATLDSLRVEPSVIKRAPSLINGETCQALKVAAERIAAYHKQQIPRDIHTNIDGLQLLGSHRPVGRVGCYVPGGRAAYPSTLLMTAVVARVAGVPEVVVCVPPNSLGRVADVTLAAAAIAQVDEVYAVGGAQAIAALAYGTETIKPVDVIVGPGNIYVALAKQQVSGIVGVPSSFAGPSEVVVVTDGSAPSDFAAIDLIVQAEHGPDGLAWLVTWNEQHLSSVLSALERLVSQSIRQSDIEATLAHCGYAVLCANPQQAMAVCNHIAPEHLQLQTANHDELLALVRNAGAVFCGAFTPASLGDYIAGPSHVLPTNGTARFASALTVDDFMKDVHVVSATKEGIEQLGVHVMALANAEGLDAHARSIQMRLDAL